MNIDLVSTSGCFCHYMPVSEVLTSIAQAPTFLDLAGFPIPDDMDGQSFKDVLLGDVQESKLVS